MDTWHIDTEKLGPVRLRLAPKVMMTSDGSIVPDRVSGAPIYMGELLVPGFSVGRSGETSTRGMRVRFVGSCPDGLEDQSVVELGGKVTVSAWYRAAENRADTARSAVTISPETMVPTTKRINPASLVNLLPLVSPSPAGLPWILESFSRPESWNVPVLTLSAPVDTYGNEGAIQIGVIGAIDEELIGEPVQLVDPVGRLVIPDRRDVGRAAKAQMVAYCKTVVPHRDLVAASNGARPAPAPRLPRGETPAPPPPPAGDQS